MDSGSIIAILCLTVVCLLLIRMVQKHQNFLMATKDMVTYKESIKTTTERKKEREEKDALKEEESKYKRFAQATRVKRLQMMTLKNLGKCLEKHSEQKPRFKFICIDRERKRK